MAEACGRLPGRLRSNAPKKQSAALKIQSAHLNRPPPEGAVVSANSSACTETEPREPMMRRFDLSVGGEVE
jgi:hypothetical protein